MNLKLHKNFIKQYQKLSKKDKDKVKERIELFLNNHFDRRLNNHPLKGKYLNYRSINIAGDLRAVYKYIDENECVFVALGTHSQLYS